MDQSNWSVKSKKRKQLTENKRYQIESLLKAGHSCKEIAAQLEVSVRTIQREKKRGLVALKKQNPSYKKFEDDYIIEYTFELIADKSQSSVQKGLSRIVNRLNKRYQGVFKTITADNGSEFACPVDIKRILQADEIYYAHPYSSYERGTNENCNGMIRRFLKKGTSFDKLSKKTLNMIENRVNNYPRKILEYATAKEVFNKLTSKKFA